MFADVALFTMPHVTASGSVDWSEFGAVLFDLDGPLVDSRVCGRALVID